jgi:hypothetical protein
MQTHHKSLSASGHKIELHKIETWVLPIASKKVRLLQVKIQKKKKKVNFFQIFFCCKAWTS